MTADLIALALAVTCAAYFVSTTLAWDVVAAPLRRWLAEAGWGSLEAAEADPEGLSTTFVAFRSPVWAKHRKWKECRVLWVKERSGLSHPLRMEPIPEDDEGKGRDAVPFLTVDADELLAVAEQLQHPELGSYVQQRRRLHQVRLVYKLVRCAVCGGFWWLTLFWLLGLLALSDSPEIDLGLWWHVLALYPITQALRAYFTRK